tara:strand:- start:407 stop:517 length:111 start_codon:yes stop_codon:yes gene_type:complete
MFKRPLIIIGSIIGVGIIGFSAYLIIKNRKNKKTNK